MSEMKEALDHKHKLFMVFKKAIENEQLAQKSYGEALTFSDDPVITGILKEILADEVRHEKKLREMYEELRRKYETTGEEKA